MLVKVSYHLHLFNFRSQLIIMTILDLRPTGFTYTATVVGRVTHVSGLPYDVSVRNKGPTRFQSTHHRPDINRRAGTPAHIVLFVLGVRAGVDTAGVFTARVLRSYARSYANVPQKNQKLMIL